MPSAGAVLCSECRRRPALAVRRPIPRLGGRLKRVCATCTSALDAQETLPVTDLSDLARGVTQVDRAVRARHLAAVRTDSPFRPPVDVADLAEDQGHLLAQRETTAA